MAAGIRIEASVDIHLRDDLDRVRSPLLQLGRELADRMRVRIHDRNTAGDGGSWARPHRRRSGQLARSIEAVETAPGVIAIRYNDSLHLGHSSAPQTNQEVAQLVFRDERMSPMVPTADEVEWLAQELARRLPASWLKTGAAAQTLAPAQFLQGGV